MNTQRQFENLYIESHPDGKTMGLPLKGLFYALQSSDTFSVEKKLIEGCVFLELMELAMLIDPIVENWQHLKEVKEFTQVGQHTRLDLIVYIHPIIQALRKLGVERYQELINMLETVYNYLVLDRDYEDLDTLKGIADQVMKISSFAETLMDESDEIKSSYEWYFRSLNNIYLN